MSYINLDDIHLEENINNRKEFIENEYKNQKNKKFSNIDDLIKVHNKLELNNYQKFITNFINPNTKYDRLLLVHSTGVGKTITSLSTALNFINIYKQEKMLNDTDVILGMVYIIGFTKTVFKKELFSRPEFGIVNKKEILELDQIKKDILKYNYEKDIAKLKELKTRYSSRLKSKRGNGFFEFIGYKELVNRLIIKNQLDYDIQLGNIKTEKELNYLIEHDIIKLNIDFLEKFQKSLIICDEIHNVYNSIDTNNWGLCLSIILNYYKENNMVRVLFLSATPINNKPIEIISLLKLLNANLEINKNDIFNKDNSIKKQGYDLIKKYIKGKVSFLKDMDIESYPSKEIHGDYIKNIPYLKFIKCPMSDLHFKTYEYESNIYNKKNNNINEKDIIENINSQETNIEDIITSVDSEELKSIVDGLIKFPINLELDKRYLNDIIFPNPNNKIGLYLKNDIIKEINNASIEWKEKYDIQLITKNKLLKNTITGNILLDNNLKKYSNKYFQMLNIIQDIIINKKGKIFIYHNFVQVSGINLISEILKINGILDFTETPTKFSKCNICYKTKEEHDKKNLNHEFQAIRFITINSMINKNIIDKELDNFNLSNNINGEEIRIILGSKAIKESYNLKEVQNLLILHQPDNISTLIQIFGRAIRKNSHINLPIENRKVNIYILVSTIPDYIQKKSKQYIYSYEEMKYKYKLHIYQIIQKINNIFVENAIDRNINYNINFPDYYYEKSHSNLNSNLHSNLNSNLNSNDLYYLEKMPKNKLIKVDYNKINMSTFQSYYYQEEINYCKYLIKRLFIEYSSVWKYNDLIKYIRNPYFKTNKDTQYISEYSIIVALDFLVFDKNNINYIYGKDNDLNNQLSTLLIDNLYNPNEKYIIDMNNNINVIYYIDEYYMLIPYNLDNINNINNQNNKNIANNLDYEVLYTKPNYISEQKINLDKILDEDLEINNYDNIKKYFINKYKNIKIDKLFNIISEFDYKFHLQFIEEIIEYLFNLYTNINYQPDVNHDLYIKVLYFYNKFNIIIFANKLDKDLEEIYGKYIIPTNLMNFTISSDLKDNYNYNTLVNSLTSESESINKNEEDNEFNPIYFNFYNKAVSETNNYLLKKNKKLKIFDYLLPIGHIFDEKIKFYHPSKYWFNKLDYNKINFKYKENNIIIGYLEKTNIGFDIIFKLREPNIDNKKVKDLRSVASGLNCLNKDKSDLVKICKLLKINLDNIKIRKNILCNLIKYELIKKELEERKKLSNIKYFYFYWEKN
jgi:hypothetical protein